MLIIKKQIITLQDNLNRSLFEQHKNRDKQVTVYSLDVF